MEKDLSSVISNLDGVAQNYGIAIVVFSAVLGVVLSGYAALKMHRSLSTNADWKDHDSSVSGYAIAIVIGALITIGSVIVGWFGLFFG